MNKRQMAKSLHCMMKGFAESIGEPPYKNFEELEPHYVELLEGAIDLLQDNCNLAVTPEDIHNYWMKWAKKYKPEHKSIIPFDELSPTEKMKDQFIINIIEGMLAWNNS